MMLFDMMDGAKQRVFHTLRPARGRRGPGDGVQPADTPAQPADSAAPAFTRAQVGAVGASFLRARPWIVAGPALGSAVVLGLTGASPVRVGLLVLVQGTMLTFFVAEAVGLARAGTEAFVSPERLGWSLALTLVGLGAGCALTGAVVSPLLPMLLAPTGIAYAAFGARASSLRFLGYLAATLVGLAVVSTVDPWPPLPTRARQIVGLAATGLAGTLLWFGVAALSAAHVVVARDLDRLRRVAVEEAALRVRDLEAVGAKVAHELKNPLAAVQALTQLLDRERPDGERGAVIQRELQRMAGTLDAYLTLARPLDDLRWDTVHAGDVVQDVAATLEGRARAAGVRLTVEVADGAVLGDRSRLQDALLNLASNALDASGRGGCVHLRVEVGDGQARFVIEDEGRGMDAETLRRVGTPYFTTRDGGTGLGVVLARSVARQHGGELELSSVPDAGTTAILRIPQRFQGPAAGSA